MLLLTLLPALAGDVILRNDTTDTYDESDQLAWLDYPECAITVLEADPGDFPLSISYVQFLLASNTGNQDGETTLAEVSLQLLADGEDPSHTHSEWGPEEFQVTVSSTALNELTLVDAENGWEALEYTEGRVAVFVCPPDPTTGESWPRANDKDEAGVVIDTSGPAAGAWIETGGRIQQLSRFISGAWVIHAGSGAGGGGVDTGGGNDTGNDTGNGNDSGDTAAGNVTITSVNPNAGEVGASVNIAILGSGFAEGAQVFIGGLAASGVSLSGEGAISATTPTALPAGTHDVLVTNQDGSSATLPAAFTVAEAGCGCDSTGGAAIGAWALVFAAMAARKR